jgi:hypothetical protein
MPAMNKDTPADPAAKAAAAADEFFGREPGTAARLLAGDLSPDPEAAYEQAAEILDEWDSADSSAYQARVEAGLEPEPVPGLEAGL